MTHNKRFSELWNIITKHISFDDKIVADIGCGNGEFIKAVCTAGAKQVYGYDKDIDQSIENLDIDLLWIDHLSNIQIIEIDINKWLPTVLSSIDILACFSTLSYLDNPQDTVKNFKTIADTVLIEMQYIGDGAGKLIKNDAEMYCWLIDCGFDFVLPIGKTHIVETQKKRTIWLCQ